MIPDQLLVLTIMLLWSTILSIIENRYLISKNVESKKTNNDLIEYLVIQSRRINQLTDQLNNKEQLQQPTQPQPVATMQPQQPNQITLYERPNYNY